MKLNHSEINLTAILVLATTLTACGGGSTGDDGTTTPAARSTMTIDASNAESISGLAYDGIDQQQNSTAVDLTGSSISSSSSQTAQAVGKVTNDYLSLNNNQNTVATAALTTGTPSCNGGGSVTVTTTSIVYADCRTNYPDNSYEITNGSAAILNLAQSGSIISCTKNSSGTYSFNNLTELEYDQADNLVDSTVVNGSISFSLSQSLVDTVCTTSSSIYGTSFSMKSDTDSVGLFNFNIDGKTDTSFNYSSSYNVTMDISSLSGSLKVETLAPIAGVATNTYPTSGHIRITANSTTAGVPALIDVVIDSSNNGGEVTLTLDVDGTAGTDAGYPKTMSWAEFEAL